MKKSIVLKEDMAHYRRKPIGSPDHCYQYLLDCMDRHLAKKREDKNMDARLKRNKNKEAGNLTALPATTGDAKKDKKKNRRGNSKSKKSGGDKTDTETADAAPAGNGTDGRGRSQTREEKVRVCRFFQEGKCRHSAADCKYKHVKLEGKELEELMKRSPSRKREPSSTRPKGKGKGGGKGGLAMGPKCCSIFLRTGACPYEVCKFEHLTPQEYNKKKAEMEKEKAKKTE